MPPHREDPPGPIRAGDPPAAAGLAEDAPAVDISLGCPLHPSQQSRNLWIFAICKGLIYLAAPVLYIGVHTPLCNWLGASTTLANLPKSCYVGMTMAPVLFAWFFPRIAQLKASLVAMFTMAALAQLMVVVALQDATKGDSPMAVYIVILNALVMGLCLPTTDALLWEMLGRGVDDSRRGRTLSLAFGVGPLLAAASSVASQSLLNDDSRARWFPDLHHPMTFSILFGATVPLMLVCAALCSRCVVPLPERELPREPFLRGVFGGAGRFLTDRVLFTATIVTVLLYAGNTIDPNMNLYSQEALGESPEQYAGLQLFLRFFTKSIAGIFLGILVSRTHPKAGLLATACVFLASVLWAMIATGPWYLVAFALYGAGELVGAYAPNYILSASRKTDIRRNMAWVTMMMMPAAPLGFLFGWVAEVVGKVVDPSLGFRLSFGLCAACILAGIQIAVLYLPARPQTFGNRT